jgi:tetratricopeptide (TPR) repeat protein
MLVDDGRLEPMGDGRFRPTGSLGELAVPDTLRALVAARLDALSSEDRDLLQHAAVLGRSFTPAALAAIIGLEASSLDGRLRALVRREVLEVAIDPRAPERGQYAFVQSVIREVAYGTLSRRDRRARHLAAARYFETLDDDELAGALAMHYLAAHEASEAGPEAEALAAQARLALRAAADRAMSLGSLEQAVTYLREALTVASTPADRAELLERAAVCEDQLARYPAAEAYAQEARTAYEAAGDTRGAAHMAAEMGGILADASKVGEAVEYLEAALDVVREPDADDLRAGILSRLSRALMRSGRNEEAIARADEALAIAEPRRLEAVIAEAFVNKGTALSFLGRWREAVAVISAGIELASATGAVALELRARNNLASSIGTEDADRANAIVREAHELATRLGIGAMSLWLAGTMAQGRLYTDSDWDASLRIIDEAMAMGPTVGDAQRLLGTAAWIGVMRGEDVTERLADLTPLVGDAGDPDAGANLHLLDALRALLERRPEEARVSIRAALTTAVQSANDCRQVLMRIALWADDATRAREALAELETETLSGRFIDAQIGWARAGLAALEGQADEAVRGFSEAIANFEATGWRSEAAFARVDACLLLPGAGEAASWAAAARPFLEGARLAPWLRALDSAALSRAEPRPA